MEPSETTPTLRSLFDRHEDQLLRVFGVFREDTYETKLGDGWYIYVDSVFLCPDTADAYQSTLTGDAKKYYAYHVVEWRLALIEGEPRLVAGGWAKPVGIIEELLRIGLDTKLMFCTEDTPLMVSWTIPRPECHACTGALQFLGPNDNGHQCWAGTWCMECEVFNCANCCSVEPGPCPTCNTKLWPAMRGVVPEDRLPFGETP